MPCDIEPSVSSVSDLPQLMSRYQQADATAVQILIRELSPQLYRFFAGCMGSRTDAEDMLQDLWLKIHQARYTYRPGEPVLPWGARTSLGLCDRTLRANGQLPKAVSYRIARKGDGCRPRDLATPDRRHPR
jgi:DNA-directed RNA polymerase specialized sigma24 family protein